MNWCIKNAGKITATFCCALLLLSGCEGVVTPLEEVDENGNRVDNSGINVPEQLHEIGIVGYAIDKSYTEFLYDTAKNIKIKGMRKATVGNTSDAITWSSVNPALQYGGVCAILYSYNGLNSEITLNDHYFAETVINKDGNGSVQSRIEYQYNSAGYLSWAKVERKGVETPSSVWFNYPDWSNANDNTITIEEYPGPKTYRIQLAVNQYGPKAGTRMQNIGYVCDVLRFANAPLTNEYIINPDLYYLGIYGTPVKYLPNETIENGEKDKVLTIVRVGDTRYYY